jgi:hypothetical protein
LKERGGGRGREEEKVQEFRYLVFGQNLRKKFTKTCKAYQTVLNSISKVPNLFFQPKKEKKAWEISQNRSF